MEFLVEFFIEVYGEYVGRLSCRPVVHCSIDLMSSFAIGLGVWYLVNIDLSLAVTFFLASFLSSPLVHRMGFVFVESSAAMQVKASAVYQVVDVIQVFLGRSPAVGILEYLNLASRGKCIEERLGHGFASRCHGRLRRSTSWRC